MGGVSAFCVMFIGRPTKFDLYQNSHDFEWKREECFMIRKPDPAVLVAVTKEPAGKLKSTSIQILDYNLNRSVFPSKLHRSSIICLFDAYIGSI